FPAVQETDVDQAGCMSALQFAAPAQSPVGQSSAKNAIESHTVGGGGLKAVRQAMFHGRKSFDVHQRTLPTTGARSHEMRTAHAADAASLRSWRTEPHHPNRKKRKAFARWVSRAITKRKLAVSCTGQAARMFSRIHIAPAAASFGRVITRLRRVRELR